MRTLWRLTRLVAGTARFLLRGSVLLVVLVMLALNVATVAFAPLSAAAGAILARAGITTVADGLEIRAVSAERRAAALDEELTAARRTISKQADEVAGIRRSLAGKSNELARLRQEDKAARQAVATFADNVSRRTATAAARNVAAIPAEALPFFGIAVILGATAWELSDACALMQDVHELNVAFDPALANDPTRHEACGLEVPTAAEVRQRVVADPADVIVDLPEDYGLPPLKEPGWWDTAMSWFGGEAPLEE